MIENLHATAWWCVWFNIFTSVIFFCDVFFCGCISIPNLATITMAWFWRFKQKQYFYYVFWTSPWLLGLKNEGTLNSLITLFFSQCVTCMFLLKMLHLLLPESLNQLFYCLFIDDSSSIRSSFAVSTGVIPVPGTLRILFRCIVGSNCWPISTLGSEWVCLVAGAWQKS